MAASVSPAAPLYSMPSSIVTERGEMKRLGTLARVAASTSRKKLKPTLLPAAINPASAVASSRGSTVIGAERPMDYQVHGMPTSVQASAAADGEPRPAGDIRGDIPTTAPGSAGVSAGPRMRNPLRTPKATRQARAGEPWRPRERPRFGET